MLEVISKFCFRLLASVLVFKRVCYSRREFLEVISEFCSGFQASDSVLLHWVKILEITVKPSVSEIFLWPNFKMEAKGPKFGSL